MTPEKKILSKIVLHLRRLRDDGQPIWWFKVHGGPMMPAGIPDLIICYHGRFIGIEVKQPGQHRTKLQLHVANLIWDALGVAAVARSIEDVSAILCDVRMKNV